MNSSHEPKFTVKQAAQLAGLSPNQLRLWQKRHGLVTPQRADNGYRLYSEQDVMVIAYVADEVRRGSSLTGMAGRKTADLLREAKRWKQKMDEKSQVAAEGTPGTSNEAMINALHEGDGAGFQGMLALRYSGLPLKDMLRKVDLPLLQYMGDAFVAGHLSVAGEHLGSNIIKIHMLSRLRSLGGQGGDSPVLLAGAPDDYHETGLLAGALELAGAGLNYLLLGAATPLDQIFDTAAQVNPKGVVVAFSSPCCQQDLTAMTARLKKGLSCPFAVTGFQALQIKASLNNHGVPVLEDYETMLSWAKSA